MRVLFSNRQKRRMRAARSRRRIARRAEKRGLTPSEYMRGVLLRQLQRLSY